MKIGIAVKWAATAVLLVVLVVGIYALMNIRDLNKNVGEQTRQLKEFQQNSLDTIGSSTTSYLSLPASSLMYDNDLSGLDGLLQPVVSESDNSTLYAAIIANDGRVWTMKAASDVDKIVSEKKDILYKADDDPDNPVQLVNVSQGYLARFADVSKLPKSEENDLEITHKDGKVSTLTIRQYTAAIKDRESNVQGYIMVGYSMEGFDKSIKAIEEEGEAQKAETLKRSLLLAILAVFIGFVVAIIQSITISKNIKSLASVASQIADGDLSVRASIKTNDEIGSLGTQFNVMADRVQVLLSETEQKAMLEKEIDIARSIQETLLPAESQIQYPHAQIAGFFKPASECGGDFWSYNALPDGSILITIGDVTGHGVPSAMITAVAKSALDTLINLGGSQLSLSRLVTELNKTVFDTAKRSLFMTFLAMRIHPQGNEIEVVNAGHNFPLFLHRAEKADVKGLVQRGNRLGDKRDSTYEAMKYRVVKNDMIMLYTDGITEYLDLNGREFGEKRLRKLFAENAYNNVSGPNIINNVLTDLNTFAGQSVQADDITMTLINII